MSTPASASAQPARVLRAWRLLTVLLLAVAAGLTSDWLRADQRLVFPRPLPAFSPDEVKR